MIRELRLPPIKGDDKMLRLEKNGSTYEIMLAGIIIGKAEKLSSGDWQAYIEKDGRIIYGQEAATARAAAEALVTELAFKGIEELEQQAISPRTIKI
jgi:hypothetical protein